MKRKKILTLGLATVIAANMSMTTFAGQWQQDTTGWWYEQDSGYAIGWQWIDGKCYYFDGNGYMLANTTTPDGYTVDASGAWVVNGVVKVQEEKLADNSKDNMLGKWELVEVKLGNGGKPDNIMSLDNFSSIISWADRDMAPFLGYSKEFEIIKQEENYFVECLQTLYELKPYGNGMFNESQEETVYYYMSGDNLIVTGTNRFSMVNAGDKSGSYYIGYYQKQ